MEEDIVAAYLFADCEVEEHLAIVFRASEAVDTGDGSNDDHVGALDERSGGAEAHFFNPVIDSEVFLNVCVGTGDVGFWLIVIVVGDEVLNGAIGEEVLELLVKLGCKSFIVGKDEGRFLCFLDDVGHREGFARASYAKEDLRLFARLDARDEAIDRLGLVSSRFIVGL